MKLRNKKTDEIVEFETTIYGDTEDRTYEFNSLAELNMEWGDYEEPKEYWFIDCDGDVHRTDYFDSKWHNKRKEIGNYFDTREEAEKAIEKLKALKRLKDNGLKFGMRGAKKINDGYMIMAVATALKYGECEDDWQLIKRDLDLLFGGED